MLYLMKVEDWLELQEKADSGDAEAQFSVGNFHEYGLRNEIGEEMVVPDMKTAAMWYQKAAEQGLSGAQNTLAICYSYGMGVEKDERQAIHWTKEAIKSGEIGSASNLGKIYRDAEQYSKAFCWYKYAYRMKDYDALYDLGKCYYFGVGVEQNPEKAVACFQEVLRHAGEVVLATVQNANCFLGLAYLQGQGCERSLSEAKKYFETANIDHDNEIATEMLLLLGVRYPGGF